MEWMSSAGGIAWVMHAIARREESGSPRLNLAEWIMGSGQTAELTALLPPSSNDLADSEIAAVRFAEIGETEQSELPSRGDAVLAIDCFAVYECAHMRQQLLCLLISERVCTGIGERQRERVQRHKIPGALSRALSLGGARLALLAVLLEQASEPTAHSSRHGSYGDAGGACPSIRWGRRASVHATSDIRWRVEEDQEDQAGCRASVWGIDTATSLALSAGAKVHVAVRVDLADGRVPTEAGCCLQDCVLVRSNLAEYACGRVFAGDDGRAIDKVAGRCARARLA
jgi:hypothetical protein